METVIEAVEPVAAAHDMSMFALFMQADWVVKSVMLGLLFASIACWAVIIAKAATYARAR
jgi:biopolymer transport protein TolQ